MHWRLARHSNAALPSIDRPSAEAVCAYDDGNMRAMGMCKGKAQKYNRNEANSIITLSALRV